jgi:putative hemolysin
MISTNAFRLAGRRVIGQAATRQVVNIKPFSSAAFKAVTKSDNARKVLMASAGLAAAVAVLQNQEVRLLFWAGRSNCGIVPLVLS